jgi:chromosome segregation protein
MRLEKIKLAGFKSFVDPTVVNFPSNLVGVVGPNGCGKSNVIDAVRWVMGESSAKMLRGESMADVIFNGSSSRKPVGTASIELIFDNADGSAGGQYAQYSEISVKRQVSRDGQSNYSLNGVRCRRRDITDLFLGTGLGPRSYSIIEQGMISRIIEARPEELRVYLEEAAGISKYKERRRETENRISHTRENLERLDDLREEVQKQLRHLERQAATAEKYKTYKTEERRVRAELLALRLSAMGQEVEQHDRQIAEQDNQLEAAVAEQRGVESSIEQQRSAHTEANDAFNQVQGRYYAAGSEIARLEEAIQYAREARRQQENELQQAEGALQEARQLSQQDQSKLTELADELERKQPLLSAAQQTEAQTKDSVHKAEADMQQWQQQWDEFHQRSNEPAQQAQVERTRINHLEQQEQQLKRRIERNHGEEQQLADVKLDAEIDELKQREAVSLSAVAEAKQKVEDGRKQIEAMRTSLQQQQDKLHVSRDELQTLKGRLASLHALQQVAKGEDDEALNNWLLANDLQAAQRLLEQIKVDAHWQYAVEIVLGSHLQAVMVDQVENYTKDVGALQKAGARLFEKQGEAVQIRPGSLAEVIQGPPALMTLLNQVLRADDLPQALSQRAMLQAGESIITPQGILLGKGWLQGARTDNIENGVLAREQEIRELSQRQESLEPQTELLQTELHHLRSQLQQAEAERDEAQKQQDTAAHNLADVRALLSGKQARAEQIRQRIQGLQAEAADMRGQLQKGVQAMEEARHRLHAALEQVEDIGKQREALSAQRDQYRDALQQARQAMADAHSKVHEIALRVEAMRSSESSLRSGIDRIQNQLGQYEQRCVDLRESLENSKAPLGEQQTDLARKLEERVGIEGQLAEARKALEAIDHQLRELEQSRHRIEQKVQEERMQLDKLRMARQEIVVRSGTLEEQLNETGFALPQLLQEMPEDAEIDTWQTRAGQLASRIQRLGPINLAAIDEFKEQSERMEYLDKQHQDVTESLETLEDAIRKIDRETRTRFKETFDKVDNGFKTLFPKLFGGGHAYLELVGEDLLDTGVSVMARPPGKRNSSIHLLSGGEKALTAVALVFAIFQLNPAPFCMLDEVDAPLDDANVGRYSNLVKEMSEHVQFIFITHNKVTMEVSNQLIGVTMQEPGVSRLVSVDVEEAAAMAAV